MASRLQVTFVAVAMFVMASAATAEQALPGTQEFGLTHRELVSRIEKVEDLIARCMRNEGFEYVAADYKTVRRGMSADKNISGMSEEEFLEAHGFGISTMYTGEAPQLADGYSPARVGLGKRNVEIFKNLSPADQVAYNRALLGAPSNPSFAVGLEIENFSRCGGCTLEGIKQVFSEEELQASFYNPLDAMIRKDPRMQAALRKYVEAMQKAGFDYKHPDDIEGDIHERLDAITEGKTVPLARLSPESMAALKKLQEYERRVAIVSFEIQEEYFEPVEEEIEEELFAEKVE